MGEKPLAVLLMSAFFGIQVVMAAGSLAFGLPFLNDHPPYWRTLLIYGCGAPYVGYLCWRQSPRARFAAYIFLTVDLLRAIRGGQWWAVPLDLAMILSMQMRAFRAAYPAIRPADVVLRLRRRRKRHMPMDRHSSSNGGGQPTNGRGRVIRH